jgi:hypothetical protein
MVEILNIKVNAHYVCLTNSECSFSALSELRWHFNFLPFFMVQEYGLRHIKLQKSRVSMQRL